MKINTEKIQREMKRVGMTLDQMGWLLEPQTDRRGAWYLIHRAKRMDSITRIAKALDMEDKDLVI